MSPAKKAAKKKAPARKKTAAKKAPAKKKATAKRAPAKKATAKKKSTAKKAPAEEEGCEEEGSGQEEDRGEEGSGQEEGCEEEGSGQEEGCEEEGCRPRSVEAGGSDNGGPARLHPSLARIRSYNARGCTPGEDELPERPGRGGSHPGFMGIGHRAHERSGAAAVVDDSAHGCRARAAVRYEVIQEVGIVDGEAVHPNRLVEGIFEPRVGVAGVDLPASTAASRPLQQVTSSTTDAT